MKITTMMLCGTMLAAAPLAAVAQNGYPDDRGDDQGAYLELQIGRSHLYSHAFDLPGGRFTTESNNGDVALLSSGYEFSQWSLGSLRVEGELGYRNNGVDDQFFNPVGSSTGRVRLAEPYGHTEVWSLMLNVINDFAPGSGFDPYIGVGVGYDRIDFHHYGAAVAGPGTPGVTVLDDVDSGVAYQGMVGFRSQLTQQLALDVNWRYFKADSPTFTTTAGQSVNSAYTAQAIMVGLAFTF
ncbi:MAG TPA: outer membrane beta-barrel protein [Gammaproteobacteria bacterium]|nr:outer membrane beta-barrel protein [Gammaproteobacteria bacterium]